MNAVRQALPSLLAFGLSTLLVFSSIAAMFSASSLAHSPHHAPTALARSLASSSSTGGHEK